MHTSRVWLLVAIVAVFVLLADATASAQATGIIRANAQGEILLDQPAVIGTIELPPGRYFVHSHKSGARQEVHFMQEMTLSTVHPESSDVIVYNEVGRVSCDTKARDSAEQVTALHFIVEANGTMRIVSADIKGESHAHVF